MAKEPHLVEALRGFRVALVLAVVATLAGCATPPGAPCSNWSALCGCYCGPGGAWSGVEAEPARSAPKLEAAFSSRATQAMSDQDMAAIRTVYIDRKVDLPLMPRVQTRSDSWVEGYGGLPAVFRAMDNSQERDTAQYLDKNNIRIGEMLADAFGAALQARNKFEVLQSPTGADAVIRFVVKSYGVEHTFNPLSSDYRTVLIAKGTMIGSGDRVVWSQVIDVESDEESLASLKELYGDPEVMRKHMGIVARMGAKRMVDHLLKTK